METTTFVNVPMDAGLKRELQRLAKADQRSTAAYVRKLLVEHVGERAKQIQK